MRRLTAMGVAVAAVVVVPSHPAAYADDHDDGVTIDLVSVDSAEQGTCWGQPCVIVTGTIVCTTAGALYEGDLDVRLQRGRNGPVVASTHDEYSPLLPCTGLPESWTAEAIAHEPNGSPGPDCEGPFCEGVRPGRYVVEVFADEYTDEGSALDRLTDVVFVPPR